MLSLKFLSLAKALIIRQSTDSEKTIDSEKSLNKFPRVLYSPLEW